MRRGFGTYVKVPGEMIGFTGISGSALISASFTIMSLNTVDDRLDENTTTDLCDRRWKTACLFVGLDASHDILSTGIERMWTLSW